MADFSRDDIDSYEKRPQKQVDEKTWHKNFMEGSTPGGVADPAAAAADATPPGKKGAAAATEETPDFVVDESVDQPVVDEGTSDDTVDSSTTEEIVEPSDETDTSVAGEESTDEDPSAQAPPKKGSAAARLQELLQERRDERDLMDGYKEFGRLKAEEAAALRAELEARNGGNTAAAPARTEPDLADQPMPKLTDPDVNFDQDELDSKMEKWQAAREARIEDRVIRKVTGQSAQAELNRAVNSKLDAFEEANPGFKKKIGNQTLIKNQLAQPASLVIARSPFTADILNYFGDNLEDAVRIAKLDPQEQLVEVGEIVATIKAAKRTNTANPSKTGKAPVPAANAGAKKSQTKAPPPPSATRAAGRTQTRDVTDPSMEMDDFAAKHREGLRGARKQR